jgi:hypothetical protein
MTGWERFLVEFVRLNDSVVAGLTAAQLFSLAQVALGFALVLGEWRIGPLRRRSNRDAEARTRGANASVRARVLPGCSGRHTVLLRSAKSRPVAAMSLASRSRHAAVVLVLAALVAGSATWFGFAFAAQEHGHAAQEAGEAAEHEGAEAAHEEQGGEEEAGAGRWRARS